MRNMEKQAVNRIEYLDISKGIGIILVVLGHIVYTNPYVMVWISSFHMPLFFIISGIMLAIKDFDRMDVHNNIRKKARALVIPYLWFSLAAFLFDIGNVTLGKIDSHTFLVNIISSVTFYGKSVLWFLIALFLAYTYFFILRRLTGDAFSIFFIILGAIVAYFLYIPEHCDALHKHQQRVYGIDAQEIATWYMVCLEQIVDHQKQDEVHGGSEEHITGYLVGTRHTAQCDGRQKSNHRHIAENRDDEIALCIRHDYVILP